MAEKQNEYQRLPGRTGFVLVTSSRLYLAKDHLLRVSSSGYSERYRRFYFTDIQALVVSRTNAQQVWIAVHLTLCALFMLWILAFESIGWRIFIGCWALFFFVKFLINLLRGPMCLSQIQTKIGSEPLPSLNRWRNAMQLLDTLKPLLQAAQGELNPAEIPRHTAGFEGQARPLQQTAPPPGSPAFSRGKNNYKGALHGWTFAVFLVEAGALAMNIFSPGIIAALLILVTTFTAAMLTILSLVKQSRSSLGSPLRAVTWGALVHVILCFVGGYVLMVFTIIQNPKISNDRAAMFISMSELHTPWISGVYTFMALYAVIIVLAGFIALLSSRAPADPAAEISSQP